MHSALLAIEVICAMVILFRSIQIAAHLDWKNWAGHPLQFIGNSICYPMLAGGSLGILLDRNGGYILLLIGVMLLILSDRRRAK